MPPRSRRLRSDRGSSPQWHVKRIEVEGLAGRADSYAQDLNPDVNIFFGLNGSGKTTLLSIIHSALNEDPFSLIGAPFASATVEVYFPETETIVRRTFTKPDDRSFEMSLRHLSPAGRRAYDRGSNIPMSQRRFLPDELTWQTSVNSPKNIGLGADNYKQFLDFSHRYLPTSRLSDHRDFSIEPGGRSLDEYFAESIQHLWSSYSAEVLGSVGYAQENGLGRILEGLISPMSTERPLPELLDPDKAFDRVRSFLIRRGSHRLAPSKEDFATRFESEDVFKRVVLDIYDVEEQIEKALEPRVRLETLVSRLISGPKQISFRNSTIRAVTKDDREISLDRLSSGEKQLIRILVETLAAAGRPIIIDEPELSMHIDWQHVLIESMKTIDDKAQVITATHAPEIMATIDDEKIFEL